MMMIDEAEYIRLIKIEHEVKMETLRKNYEEACIALATAEKNASDFFKRLPACGHCGRDAIRFDHKEPMRGWCPGCNAQYKVEKIEADNKEKSQS